MQIIVKQQAECAVASEASAHIGTILDCEPEDPIDFGVTNFECGVRIA